MSRSVGTGVFSGSGLLLILETLLAGAPMVIALRNGELKPGDESIEPSEAIIAMAEAWLGGGNWKNCD